VPTGSNDRLELRLRCWKCGQTRTTKPIALQTVSRTEAIVEDCTLISRIERTG
jgi:ribosomal protein L44E